MSAADCPDCKAFLEETNRLHAKVERLTVALRRSTDDFVKPTVEQALHEREEALAQMVAFMKECSCHDWTSERLFSVVIDEARDLLARLRLAEAVVEAVKDNHSPGGSECREPVCHICQALAAYEESK